MYDCYKSTAVWEKRITVFIHVCVQSYLRRGQFYRTSYQIKALEHLSPENLFVSPLQDYLEDYSRLYRMTSQCCCQ